MSPPEVRRLSTGLPPEKTSSPALKLASVNGLWQDNTNFNTAVGDTALPVAVSQSGGGANGQNNVGLGYQALNANTTGKDNTAVGSLALAVNTTGYYNTAMGYGALAANTTGVTNTAMGYGALDANTTGAENTAIGFEALLVNTTGVTNTAFGGHALVANTIGSNNAAFGNYALDANTTGNNNMAIGYSALVINTTGSGNTAIGVSTLYKNTTGLQNTAIGYAVASTTQATGSGNILIGTSNAVDVPSDPTSNFLNIGNVIFATGMTGTLSSPAGNVGIGSTAPAATLEIAGAGSGSFNGAPALVNIHAANVTPYALNFQNDASGGTSVGLYNDSGALHIANAGANTVGVYADQAIQSSSFFISRTAGKTDVIMNSAGSDYGYIQNDAANKWSLAHGTTADGTLGTAVLTWNATGNVGIGTTTPQSTLDVNGYMRLAKNSTQPAACSSANDGAIALTHVYTLCICNGGSTSWVQSKDGSTACSW